MRGYIACIIRGGKPDRYVSGVKRVSTEPSAPAPIEIDRHRDGWLGRLAGDMEGVLREYGHINQERGK